jgi:hypothetical protein
VEMGDNQRNANDQENKEYQNARAVNGKQRRAYDVEHYGNFSHQLRLVPIRS